MKKLLQFTLLLSCLSMLCSNNVNATVDVDVWASAYSLEENFTDTDNNELDGTLAESDLFSASLYLAKQKFLLQRNDINTPLFNGFIRAPPKFLL